MAINKHSIDLEYVFLGVKFDIEFSDDSFTKEEENDIVDFIDVMSRRICIDKSYVDCRENRRKNAFMLEKGWNALNEIVLDTKYCQYLDDRCTYAILDAFMTMIKCYMYDCLAMKTDKFADILLTIDSTHEFDVIICKDSSNDYKNYPGPWQTWEFDDNGNFLSASPKINEVNNIDE